MDDLPDVHYELDDSQWGAKWGDYPPWGRYYGPGPGTSIAGPGFLNSHYFGLPQSKAGSRDSFDVQVRGYYNHRLDLYEVSGT